MAKTTRNEVPYATSNDVSDAPTNEKDLAEKVDKTIARRAWVKADGTLGGGTITPEKTATGKYRLTGFGGEWPNLPVCVVTPAPEPGGVTANGDRHAIVVQDELSKLAIRIWIYNAAGALVDCPFHVAVFEV